MALPSPADDCTALITGASSGIGEAIARDLAARGHGVTLVARRRERLEQIAADLSSEHKIRAEAVGCDLGQVEERDRLVVAVEELGLTVDVLVNNAGFGSFGEFASSERARQVGMVELNVAAVVDLTGRYLSGMVERGGGAVINIASTAAFQPLPNAATYAASKAFVLSHTEALHTELKGTGVSITAVCPGPVRTEFMEQAAIGDVEERTPGLVWMSPEEVAKEAIKAAEKGQRSVVPGLLNNAGTLLGRHTPRTILLPLVKRMWGGIEE